MQRERAGQETVLFDSQQRIKDDLLLLLDSAGPLSPFLGRC